MVPVFPLLWDFWIIKERKSQSNGNTGTIALGFLDYKRKVGGIGKVVQPTGDIEQDMKIIRAFYQDISGKYPLKSIASAAVATRPVT